MTQSEIDSAVAKKLGWDEKEESGMPCTVPNYSTDISAAWQIVGKYDYLYLFHSTGFGWECKLTIEDRPELYARNCTSAPMAICLAFLRVEDK